MTVFLRPGNRYYHYPMKQIPLTQGQVAIVDDADFEWLSQWKWQAVKRGGDAEHYAHRIRYLPGGKTLSLMMHRVIMGIEPSTRVQVDHINRDTLDNRRENLRIATPAQNKANSKCRRDSALGIKGVRQVSKGCFTARITRGGKIKLLGCFPTAEEAAAAYAKAAVEYYGEFARWESNS